MLNAIRQMIRPSTPRPVASVPVGQRWYVIGDVHGCCDLLKALADAIERDDAKRAEADTTVVLLGDLIDRGPDSAGAVQFAREWGQTRKVRHLAGNHEEMFLESFSQVDVLRHFLRHGGKETIHSYGIKGDQYNAMTMPELQTAMQQAVPASDRDFLAGAEVLIEAGDYLFVHAGIDPDRPHTDQKRSDLLWIRERFLRHPHAFSHVVVHGHTIVDEVEDTGTRIGIDTGAYRTGRLTALILEGSGRRTIQAVESNGSITIVTNGD